MIRKYGSVIKSAGTCAMGVTAGLLLGHGVMGDAEHWRWICFSGLVSFVTISAVGILLEFIVNQIQMRKK